MGMEKRELHSKQGIDYEAEVHPTDSKEVMVMVKLVQKVLEKAKNKMADYQPYLFSLL